MKKQKENGFTLIELLVAVFVLSTVLLAMSTMVYSVMQSTSMSKEMSTATVLAQDKLETIKNTALTYLIPGNETVQRGNINYVRQWSVSPTGNIRTITVTVNWVDRGSHTVAMTTLRGE